MILMMKKCHARLPKVIVEVPRFYYSVRSTDWRLKIKLADFLGGESAPKSLLYSLVYNAQYFVPRFLPRFSRFKFNKLCMAGRRRLLEWQHPCVVVSQGCEPPLVKGAQIIWETYFLDPQPGEDGAGVAFERGCADCWMQAMETYGGKVFRIAVRGSYSVDLVKRKFPELAAKVVDLGFVHPEYEILSEDEIKQKQAGQEVVKILFVGRQARLKGLPVLIEAMQLLRRSGATNFSLTVVSTLRDGHVDLPLDEGWINYYKEVSHSDAMRLFRESQIFAMPTRRDSYGLVFHEALASGCVVCVPDREPQREFVDYGKAGIVLHHLSAVEMAAQLGPVIEDAELRTRLAVAGRKRYLDKFSQQVIRKQWSDIVAAAMED